ncbi:MAG TPA: hypothetical protein VK837_01755 [Longimicrobiales bacterium]|nr:hypothetical protein [Longimicrobiales bacterium]
MTTPRRFDDDEIRAIFGHAAERQEQARAAERRSDGEGTGGLSLEELQEIGAATGIDPAHIAAAAEGIARGALVRRGEGAVPAPPTAPSGKPLLHQSRPISRVDDETWERLVAALRREAKVAGITGQVGRVREWAKDADSKESTPLTVRVVPDGDHDRLEVTEGTEQLYRVPKVLGGVMAGNAALIGLLMLLPMGGSGPPAILPAFFAGIGAAIWGGGTAIARVVSRRKAERLAAVADRLTLLAAKTPDRER